MISADTCGDMAKLMSDIMLNKNAPFSISMTELCGKYGVPRDQFGPLEKIQVTHAAERFGLSVRYNGMQLNLETDDLFFVVAQCHLLDRFPRVQRKPAC